MISDMRRLSAPGLVFLCLVPQARAAEPPGACPPLSLRWEGEAGASGTLEVEPSGRRTMRRQGRVSDLFLAVPRPDGAGETYLDAGKRPVLEIRFERDRDGRIAREVLLWPAGSGAVGPGADDPRRLGWLEYRRARGQVAEVVYRFHPGGDRRWQTDDDVVEHRIVFRHEQGRPTEAIAFTDPGPDGKWSTGDDRVGQRLRFTFDARGRWTGASGAGDLRVTAGACDAPPERIAVLLASPATGLLHPAILTEEGAIPRPPR